MEIFYKNSPILGSFLFDLSSWFCYDCKKLSIINLLKFYYHEFCSEKFDSS